MAKIEENRRELSELRNMFRFSEGNLSSKDQRDSLVMHLIKSLW